MKEIHFLVFDGTSHYVCGKEDLTTELKIIKRSDNIKYLDDLCEELNDKIIS